MSKRKTTPKKPRISQEEKAAYLSTAKEIYEDPNCEIDGDAALSPVYETNPFGKPVLTGAWVAAWVWVPVEDLEPISE